MFILILDLDIFINLVGLATEGSLAIRVPMATIFSTAVFELNNIRTFEYYYCKDDPLSAVH